MTQSTKWLLTEAELAEERDAFCETYFGSDGHIFEPVYGAGYWLYGVEYHPNRGWLAFEFDESTFDKSDEEQHAVAIRAWQKGKPLPQNYFALTRTVMESVFNNGLRKWGEAFTEDNDLPKTEEALQGTLFDELRYG